MSAANAHLTQIAKTYLLLSLSLDPSHSLTHNRKQPEITQQGMQLELFNLCTYHEYKKIKVTLLNETIQTNNTQLTQHHAIEQVKLGDWSAGGPHTTERCVW